MSDYATKRKLKPSGVIYQTHIDPDASSDEEQSITRMERSSLEKRVSSITDKLGGAVIEKIDKKAAAELKAKKEEALRKKKERDAKFKEINKNFARKDKRDTHRFLIKHGLTPEEAKRYT